MIIQAVSGVLVSRHLYTFLSIQGYASIARSLHMLGAYWNFVLMSLHLGLHWSIVLAPLRRVSQGKMILLRTAGTAIAILGVFVFFRRGIGPYLLGQIQFAFFDFEEPLFFFFLDYLTIMGLFIWVGHCLGILLRKLTPKEKEVRK